MPNNQIQKGYDFSTGQLVTADNLDNLAQEATLRKGAISEQPAQTDALTDSDEIIVNDVSDLSSTTPKKATIAQIFNSRVDITAKSITAPSGESITLNPIDGSIFNNNAFSSVDGLNVSVNKADHGLVVGQLIEISNALSGVISKPAYNGKYLVTEITSTSVFVYRLDTSTAATTGTLTYKKEGAVIVNNNLIVNSDARYVGSNTFQGNTRFTGSNVFQGSLSVSTNMVLPSGTTAERPVSPAAGTQRFNTTNNRMEFYNGTEWLNVVQSSTTDAQTGWIFQGYTKIEITGSTVNSGTVTVPAFESSNFSIPEAEYWIPVKDFIIRRRGVQTLTFNQTLRNRGSSDYFNLGSQLAPAHYASGEESYLNTDTISGTPVKYIIQQPNGDSPYNVIIGANTVYPYWSIQSNNTINFYKVIGTDIGSDGTPYPLDLNVDFTITPQNLTSPDANGTVWVTEKGYRGGQTFKINRPSYSSYEETGGSYTEKFVLWFERWRKA